MENFEFKSQICATKEQSEKLLKLGLKKETADMYITNMSSKGLNYTDDWQIGTISYCNAMSFWDSKGLQLEKTAWSIIPAWSLHRLIETIDYSSNIDAIKELLAAKTMFNDRLYDRVIDIIEHLIQRDEFNKDYLEERVWQ